MGGALPRLPRVVVRVDFGDGPRHLTAAYTAPADVIARLVPLLKDWNPDIRLTTQPLDTSSGADPDAPPMLPTWRLFLWE
ncbi:hypothetical protein [Nocardia wallacei]|uniref:hypothetical protein n=1 Tax=Nocardia wallacei TaxID=480035 RepID=UPI00245626E5|nr:hypothetical protein [Nocardia wallacei]